jgi:MSHA biogenesis protein MshJ
MIKSSASLQLRLAQVTRLWRKWRRIHAARSPNERRLLVVGAIAITWFITDTLFLTPALARFKTSSVRYDKANVELRTKEDEQRRYNSDMVAMTAQLKGDVERMRADVIRQKKDIDAFQDGLVPAREMRNLLQTLLARHDDVRLISMKTLSGDDVRKLSPGTKDMPGLYRHGMELKLQGRFASLLDWLLAAENSPRKLMWSGMRLEVDSKQQLFLTVNLFTLSPDAEPLEIAAP